MNRRDLLKAAAATVAVAALAPIMPASNGKRLLYTNMMDLDAAPTKARYLRYRFTVEPLVRDFFAMRERVRAFVEESDDGRAWSTQREMTTEDGLVWTLA